MGLISEETIRQVVATSDIVEVISTYFPLKRVGNSWRALCPFHMEDTPSFYINPTRQTFHCFGCGASGTVIRFIMNYEQVEFPTAVQRLAQRAGISVLELNNGRGSKNVHMRLLVLHSEVTTWFHANLLKLPEAVQARQYLQSRGFSKETILRWKIGYAPASWQALSEWAISCGFSYQELLHSGLVSRGKGAANLYDRFRERIMFPICSTSGEVIAFSGRIMRHSLSDGKYLNSPDTPLFSKRRVLFGLDKTKHALIRSEEAVVCEGQIDLISCFEAGIHNVVSPQGTVLSQEQVRLLKRYVKRVLLCFDADSAGKKAITRSLPILYSYELAVKIVRIPLGQDPHSVIKQAGPQAFRELLVQAPDYFDFAIDQAIEAGSLNPSSQVILARKFAALVVKIKTLALREVLSMQIASRLGISSNAFNQLLEKKNVHPQLLPHGEAATRSSLLSLQEGPKLLCRLALFSLEVRSWLLKQTAPSVQELFPDRTALLQKILTSNVVLDDPLSFSVFLESLDLTEVNTILAWDLYRRIPATPLTVAKDCWRGIVRNYLKARQESARTRLKNVKPNSEAHLTIQKEFLDLQEQLQDTALPFRVCRF